jgi:glycine/D-amino acid oxidase-like deaminating enzyme
MVDKLPIPISTDGAIHFSEQAQFHPIRFISQLVRDLEIYENTAVKQLVGCAAITDHGTIRARKIIVATHFPFINKHGSYFLKLYQHRSYVFALDHVPRLEGMYVDESNKGLSFRMAGEHLLLGGGGHRTGKQGGSYPELEEMAHVYYPNSTVRMRWATQDCISLDGIPYIGNYSASTPDLYVATGFCKWGMTSSMVAASVLTDLIRGRENAYAHVFSPSRSLLHPQLAFNGAEAMINLITPTKKRCPHLGCALKWNPQEHTWDCPCHGSRFSEDGRLLDNPATGDLRDK